MVFLLALGMRAGWGGYRHVQAHGAQALEFPDEQQYWSTSRGLRAGVGLRDELGFRATRMPLYPSLLAMFPDGPRGLLGARALQWILGALGAVFAAGVANSLFDRRVGWLSGCLVALDPFLIFFSSLLLTETLFVTVSLALWWMLAHGVRGGKSSLRSWVGVGVVSALCVYIRESGLGLIAVVLCFVVIRDRFRRTTVAGAVLSVMLIVVSLIPWAVRNQRTTEAWCWLTTRAGISLYDGVRPGATGASDLGNIKNMPAVRSLSESEWNRYFLEASWTAIQEDPARIVRLAGTKMGRMWNPFPNVKTYQSSLARTVSAAWVFPTFVFAGVGAVLLPMLYSQAGLQKVIFLLLPAVYSSALHCVFVGSIRYRLGAAAMIEILAAATVFALIGRWRSRDGVGGRISSE